MVGENIACLSPDTDVGTKLFSAACYCALGSHASPVLSSAVEKVTRSTYAVKCLASHLHKNNNPQIYVYHYPPVSFHEHERTNLSV